VRKRRNGRLRCGASPPEVYGGCVGQVRLAGDVPLKHPGFETDTPATRALRVAVTFSEGPMFKRKPNPHSQEPSVNLSADEFGFDDFAYRALARKQDPVTQHAYIAWMVARMLGIPHPCSRRISPEAIKQQPGCYLIKLCDFDPPAETFYALCRTRKGIDRSLSSWQAWSPDNWDYFLFTHEELAVAGVFRPSPLNFFRRDTSMTAPEFRAAARARLGLAP
jgi:hypothetical protein